MRRLITLLAAIPLPLALSGAGGAGAPAFAELEPVAKAPATVAAPALAMDARGSELDSAPTGARPEADTATAGPSPLDATSMATVPAGTYLPLYSPATAAVEVDGFRLDRHPVTRAQYAQFVRSNPEWRRSRVKPVFADQRYLRDWNDDLQFPGDSAAPVTGVSWFAARSYCGSIGRRLPTVDEWELVARADENRPDAMSDPAHKRRVLELTTRRPDPLAPVGSTFTNVYGVSDLHGLVWEWVREFNTVTVGTDSRGTSQRDAQLYCAAGAEGATDSENYAAFLRYAFRASLEGRSTSASLGFRCAADLDSEE